jgi:hypothetical protein
MCLLSKVRFYLYLNLTDTADTASSALWFYLYLKLTDTSERASYALWFYLYLKLTDTAETAFSTSFPDIYIIFDLWHLLTSLIPLSFSLIQLAMFRLLIDNIIHIRYT